MEFVESGAWTSETKPFDVLYVSVNYIFGWDVGFSRIYISLTKNIYRAWFWIMGRLTFVVNEASGINLPLGPNAD